MLSYFVDARDAFPASANSCSSCCCQSATARPGETNKMGIIYTPWVAPLGGRGLVNKTQFEVEQVTKLPDPNAPINTNYYFPVEFNTPLVSSVATGATDPAGGTLTYGLVQLYGPDYGSVVVNTDGTFTYTPTLGYAGYDEFYVETSNGLKSIVTQVIVGVKAQGATADLPPFPFDKPLAVVMQSVKIDRMDHLSFAIKASPTLRVGEIYRLTVKQPAIDCDCTEYVHVSCYDFIAVKC